jgi:hypothetical protein
MTRTKKNKNNVDELKNESTIKLIEEENKNIITVEETKDNESIVVQVKNKRGRKPKKVIESTEDSIKNDNISCEITDNNNEKTDENIIISESISFVTQIENKDNETNVVDENNILNDDNEENNVTKTIGKKRGRKPKGGKIIQQVVPIINNNDNRPNVILHLKCSLKDLSSSNLLNNNNIESYSFNSIKNELNYEIISTNSDFKNKYVTTTTTNTIINKNYNQEDSDECEDNVSYKDSNDIQHVWKKLKNLEHNLHINNISDKKSACFWCTCEFDNPPVYIPKYFMKDSYHVYGCFCSPECATAYLMEENIDSSTKFERYHLINHIYGKIYNYTKNIKPAPNPYYMLDKFYGNLSIQEYRSLLKNERLFLIVDKPLTRILPELHEDNDDFIINNKIIPSNTYQIKKKMQKQTKTNILNEKFGLNTH